MQIKINGKSQSIDGAVTITELLARLGIENRNLAIEYNGDFLEEDALATTTIQDGDTLEIVRFVGGG